MGIDTGALGGAMLGAVTDAGIEPKQVRATEIRNYTETATGV